MGEMVGCVVVLVLLVFLAARRFEARGRGATGSALNKEREGLEVGVDLSRSDIELGRAPLRTDLPFLPTHGIL